MEKNHGLGKFLAGAAIGVGLGILFAPKSGAETRKDLSKKFDELMTKVKEIDIDDVKASFTKKINEIKEELADLDKEKVASIAKEKAAQIKAKLDDLYEEAKEKATPVIQKSVEELRKKTVVVLKGFVSKLEESEKPKKEIKKIAKKDTK